ncbi:MAG: TfoX/Sxy family DNA transformation protein [Bacteroidota bacterium]
MELHELPNIGKELSERIESAGFTSAESLKSAGSQKVFLALNALDPAICINTLYALEGAVRGIRWHKLTTAEKSSLLRFYNLVKSSESTLLK